MVTELRQRSLTRVRTCRVRLREALQYLERATASPAPGREEEWAERVRAALLDLQTAFGHHMEVTEGPEGLLRQIETDAPRLENRIVRLRAEHERLDGLIRDALLGIDDQRMTPDDIRLLVGSIHSALLRHRQAGADLVYQAYEVDIGGGED